MKYLSALLLAVSALMSGPAYALNEVSVALDLSPRSLKQVNSTWEQYFCRNYGTARTAGMMPAKTIRDYDGPNVSLPAGFDVTNGYLRDDVLRNFRNWRRPDARGMDLNAAELVNNGLSAIYIAPAPKPDGMLDAERVRALLDSLYTQPGLERNVYIQWGNEINGKHIGLPQVNINEMLGLLEASSSVNWSLYNRPEDQQPFVENYFLPAVSLTREVSAQLFGNPRAIRVMSPSFANVYNPQFREWMYGILDYPVDANKFPGLGVQQTWETIDILTVHYPFARPDGAAVMQEIWDRYGATGKIDRLWVTEDYGRDTSGPAGLVDRGMRYFAWLAANRLDAGQTRLCWWGIDQEYPGGRPVEAAVEMGDWLYGRRLRYRQFDVNGEIVDAIYASGGPSPRYLLVFRAAPRAATYRISLTGANFRGGGAKATLYGVATKPAALPAKLATNGSRLDIDVDIYGDGPLLLFIGE
jgi:hypothetical protein